MLQLIRKPWIEWVLLALSLLPFVAISAFNHPTDDDFQGAVVARHLGFWEGIGFYYRHWTGRYTSSFFYSLAYEASDLHSWLRHLRLAPVLMLGALLLAAQFALSSVLPNWPRTTTWRLACYVLVLYLAQVPLVASALYWLNGSAVYTVGCVLALLLLGLTAREAQAVTRQAQWGVGATVVAFLLVGTNELFMLVTVVGSTAWIFLVPQKRRFWPGILLGATLAGSVFTLVAPGNSSRAAVVTDTTPWLTHLLNVSGKGTYLIVSHVMSWASSGILLLGTLAFFSMYPAAFRTRSNSWYLWTGLVGIAIIAILTVPTLWLTNDVPARIWNILYFLFLLLWFTVATSVLRYWKPLLSMLGTAKWLPRILGVAWLLVVLLDRDTNVHQAYVDLIFRARQYDAAQLRRYNQLRQAHQYGLRMLDVPPLLANEYQYPATIFLHELEPLGQNIANEGMASYFGLDSIRILKLPRRTNRHFSER